MATAVATATEPTFRKAVLLMTATSFLVPAAGVITAPVLARALSIDGRGELAAALAPAYLTLAAATLGLPDALTYLVAKRPSITRRAVLVSSLITLGLGLVCLLATYLALPFLSGGSESLGRLILLATALTVPALVAGVFRGAATGRQMWRTVAIERLIITGLRIVLLGTLWLSGHLTVLVAVIVSAGIPILGGLVYAGLLLKSPAPADPASESGAVLRPLMSFGTKVWLGSVASMLLSRVSQLLMVPLSSVEDLGLYTVATTISDLPLIVALAIQGALFGVNSKTTDAAQVTTTARLTILAGFLGCIVLGGTLPFWIKPLFGAEFGGALIPTVMLLCSAILCIPGLMASTGLSAWGRPGLRSAGLAVTLVANVGAFVLLVPSLGVIGACWTSIISNVVMSSFMVVLASRVMQVRARDFCWIRGGDVVRAWSEAGRLLSMVTRTRGRRVQ